MAFASLLALGVGLARVVDAREAAELVAEARHAAQIDQNARSASLFAEALERRPVLRRSVLREYADQLLYAGQAAEAIPLLREALATPGLDPAEVERSHRSLALAYLWAGQYAEAVAAYEDALARRPGDADLTRNYIDALVGAAHDAAEANRNRESAERFARAIELAPARRAALLQDYADQLTYSGRAAAAVALYCEIIAREFGADTPITDRRLLASLGLALQWAGQPEEARRIYERLLELEPENADARKNLAEALVSLARRAASIDHNAEAARLYERALALTHERQPGWLKDYADQLTYTQRTTEAVSRYDEILRDYSLSPQARAEVRLSRALAQSWRGRLGDALGEYEALIAEDPDNLRARKGRAEVLAWRNRNGAASAELRAALALAPGDRDLQRRLARSESYRGRHRAAIALARPLFASDPTDEEAAIILAESQRWMGRPDEALKTLETLLSVRPDSERAQALRAEIGRDRRPRSTVRASASTQSDDLTIWSAGFRQAFWSADGLTSFGPQLQRVSYDPDNGSTVTVDRVGAFLHRRFSDAVELNSSVFIDFQQGGHDHAVFTHDSFVTLFPNDAWRVDLGATRQTLDNIKSLELGLAVDSYGGSVDFWPTTEIKLTGRAAWSDYSDGNTRWWGQAEGKMRVVRGPDLWFGARFTAFDFAKQLDNGYFNPDDQQSLEGTVEAAGTLLDRFRYQVTGAAGYEDTNPDGTKFIWSAGLTVRYALSDLVDAEMRVAHSSSTLGSDSGFERTSLAVGLNMRW